MIIMSHAKGLYVHKGNNIISPRNPAVRIPVGALAC